MSTNEVGSERRVSLSIAVATPVPVTIRVPKAPGYAWSGAKEDEPANAEYSKTFYGLEAALSAVIASLPFSSERCELTTDYDNEYGWQYVRFSCVGQVAWEVRFHWDGEVEHCDNPQYRGDTGEVLWNADDWIRGVHLLVLDLVGEAEDDLNCAVQRLESLKARTCVSE